LSGTDQREGFFAARDNLRLFWRATEPRDARAWVGVVHGYGEHSGRYVPLFDHLAENGIASAAFDYRGHGQADGRRGHCDSFGEYLDDLDRFHARLEAEAAGRPVFLLGHSLGGLIVARWLLEAERPGLRGAIFASPFLELALKPSRLKVAAARLAGRVVPWLQVSNELTSDMLTRDEEMRRLVDRDPLYNRTTTPRWFEEAMAAQEQVRAGAHALRVPALVLVAEDDSIARPEAAVRFFEELGAADKTLRRFPGARHELFNELPEVRRRAMDEVVAWIRERSG